MFRSYKSPIAKSGALLHFPHLQSDVSEKVKEEKCQFHHADSASDEICPCCYIQFGYDDTSEPQKAVYDQWRKRWIEGGMKWLSKSRKPPKGWDPNQQLQRSGLGAYGVQQNPP
jgi:hypothetical protein